MSSDTPGLLRRLAGYLIDWYLSTMVCGGVLVFANSMRTGVAAIDTTLPEGPGGLLLGAVACAIGVLYYVLFPICWKGQTPAKRLLRLRIVTGAGEPPKIGPLLLRQLVGGVLLEGAILFPSQLLREVVAMLGFSAASEVLRMAAVVLTLISIVLAIFLPGRRMLHDLISGTHVVSI